MDGQALLQVIYLIVVIINGLQVTRAITCYDCKGDMDFNGHPYDPECDNYDYHGDNIRQDASSTCAISIYDSGHVVRFNSGTSYYDGQCNWGKNSYGNFTSCHCTGDFCNTNSFCAQCGYPKPTPGTTELTTSTTTTTERPGTLKCYHCIDCSTVDDSTPVVENEFLSCVTVMLMESTKVMRGGSYDEHLDGECIHHKGTFSCWCSKDYCNDYAIAI